MFHNIQLRSWICQVARYLSLVLLTVLVGGLLGATMIRFGPGFGVDETDLDPRLDEASIQALRDSRSLEQNIVQFYARYLGGMLKGDLGFSHSLSRPVSELLSERTPVTFDLIAIGVAGGWLLGLALALPAALLRTPVYDLLTTILSGIFLCLPSAVLALLLFLLGGPIRGAVALIVFPKVFRYARNLVVHASSLPHVLAARARGLGSLRILLRHIIPVVAPQLLALAGVSVSLAFGAAVPIEVICDLPGIGQLAWKAALARDLPVLVALTILIAAGTQLANSASDLLTSAWRQR